MGDEVSIETILSAGASGEASILYEPTYLFQILHLQPNRPFLAKFALQRLRAQAGRVIKLFETIPPGAIAESVGLLAKQIFAASHEAISPSKTPDPWVTQATMYVRDEAEQQAFELSDLGRRLEAEVSAAAGRLRGASRSTYENAQSLLKEGLALGGLERKEAFQESAMLLREFASPDGYQSDPIAWMQLGWFNWTQHGNLSDAKSCFQQAQAFGQRTISDLLAGRMEAYLHALEQDFRSAYDITIALKRSYDPVEPAIEAARYCALCGDMDGALVHIGECLDRFPLSIAAIYGEPAFQQRLESVVLVANATRDRIGNAKKESIDQWANAIGRIRWAEKAGAFRVGLGSDLKSPAALAQPQGVATLLDEARLLATTESRKVDAMNFAENAFAQELARRSEIALSARSALNSCQRERERHLEPYEWAKKEAEQAILNERASPESSSAGPGCGWGMVLVGAGGGVLALGSAFFSSRGESLRADSPAGLLVFALSAAPVLVFASFMGTSAIKRGAMQAELAARAKEASVKLEIEIKVVDSKMSARFPALRQALMEAEVEEHKMEKAMAMLANLDASESRTDRQ